jgi:hypothetical protein
MCEMGLMMNTRNEQQHIEYLLTKEAFDKWFDELSESEWQDLAFHYKGMTSKKIYLKEHGLPIDSVIKGL